MTQNNQPITTRFLTWAECFTTTAETPVNTRFVNADGKSIMDLLAEEGTDIVAFYQAKGDIHAFLEKRGAKLDDFTWDSPFGVLSISKALAKINAGEIKIPIGGRSQMWTLERLLCFKGNTYAELFVSTGTIVYGRMREMAQQVSVKKLVVSMAIATVGLGYASYYASVGFWSLLDGDISSQEEVAQLSELVVENALANGLPVYKSSFSQFLPVNAKSIADAKQTAESYIKDYGTGVAGNHWAAIQASIARIEASQGRSGVDQAAITNFFSLVKGGLPLNPQSCSEIAADPSLTRMGSKYSIALYAGALDEQDAVAALSSMTTSWRETGKVNLPVRSQMLTQVPNSNLSRALWHVGSTLENGGYSECAIAPIVGITPKDGTWIRRNFTLVSMLVRTPLVNGDASVSMRLYAFASNENGSPAKLIELKAAGGRDSFTQALVTQIPDLAPESLDSSCASFNVEAPTTEKEAFAVYKGFLDSTPGSFLADSSDFTSWEKAGDFPKHVPVVDLDQFITHRKAGDCLAMPVVAYKLNSDSTKYLVSAITKSSNNQIRRDLVSVYDTGEERGVIRIGGSTQGFKGAEKESFKKTLADLAEDLRGTPYGNPDVSVQDVKDVVSTWAHKNGVAKDEGDIEQKLEIADKNIIAIAVNQTLKETKNAGAMIDYESIVKFLVEADFVKNKETKDVLMSDIAKGVATQVSGQGSIDVDGLTSVIQVSLGSIAGHGEFTDESRAALKAVIVKSLAEEYGYSDLSIKDAFANADKSDLESIKQRFSLFDFMYRSSPLSEVIRPVYESVQASNPVLSKVSYEQFSKAICSAYGSEEDACREAFDSSKQEFLNI